MDPLIDHPSLITFGPQSELPSLDALNDLRAILAEDSRLASLRYTIRVGLPRFWRDLLSLDPSLKHVPGAKCINDIQQWLDGEPALINAPNTYALPLTHLLHIAQYIKYLDRVNKPHSLFLSEIKNGGVQGFCIGFLSAVAVGCSDTVEDISSIAASCLRLAVCIGAYIDQDGSFAQPPNKVSCVALRWKEGNVQRSDILDLVKHYSAYVSSINDDACFTVTASASDVPALSAQLQSMGVHIKVLDVEGRFHSSTNSLACEKILNFVASDFVSFPTVEELRIPMRSAADTMIITSGSLVKIALENTLMKSVDWYGTIKAATSMMSSRSAIGCIGLSNYLPASVIRTSGIHVVELGDNQPKYPPHSVAIVGMACRLPGADSLDEFWQLLMSGTSMVRPAPVERLNLPRSDPADGSPIKWWGNFLNDPNAFDHKFFGKSSREALAWDPQQRILLETIYEALESSGYFGAKSAPEPNDYGCYIGAVMNNYYDNISCQPQTAYATLGTSRCFLSGAMSHYFGWTGPALTIDTACSSSLVAINTACRAIMSGECSRAIAGGTNVFTSPFDYQNLRAAGFLSPTGQCKPFDASCDGYSRGEGVGVVVLKPLATAIAEGDNVLGVILGSAANQNENHSHITVPHSDSQVKLYRNVMTMAGIKADNVSYVEAHGTGTGVGDPIESLSLRTAFGGPHRKQILRFSSVKGSIGHTEATAGIAGLIKVLLMMHHEKIPKQVGYSIQNPKIPPFAPDRMEIPRSIFPWSTASKVALVNSYGAAGSNAALLVRQMHRDAIKSQPQLAKYPLIISASSEKSLTRYCDKLRLFVEEFQSRNGADVSLADLAFNMADRANHALPHSLSTTVSDIAELQSELSAAASGLQPNEATQKRGPIVLVFGGQESDCVGLSDELYHSSTLFRQHLDHCDKLLRSRGFEGLYPHIFQSTPVVNLVSLHASLFSTQYAAAKSWIACGMEVSAVIGHSFGQLTALCIAGCLSLDDALKLITGRASIMLEHWGPERGSMLSLQTDEQTAAHMVEQYNRQCEDQVEIACYNSPNSHVVVGSRRSIDAMEQWIAADPLFRGMRTKSLKVTHGFHSKFTEPMLPRINTLAKGLNWMRPTIYLETCDEARSCSEPDFTLAASHTRRPVYFERAVKRLMHKFPGTTFLESGRGSSVIQLIKSCTTTNENLCLSPQLASANATSSLANITANLWKAGHATQFWPFHRSQRNQYSFLILPPYSFEKVEHWLPFTRHGDFAPSEVLTEQPEDAFFTLVKFEGPSKTDAVFTVSQHSERFLLLINGHVMAGQPLFPASANFELAARAAIFLHPNTGTTTYVPCVENLEMRSPVGLDHSKKIILRLKRVNSETRWSFTISTQPIVDDMTHNIQPFIQTTGTVFLRDSSDTQAARALKPFERVASPRIEHIFNDPHAEGMHGKHVYRAFNHIVHYNNIYRGIKSVACVGEEAAGKVVIDVNSNAAPDQRLCDTPMVDSFMQFAGFLVNYFNNPSLTDVLVCSRIEHIEIGADFNPDAKEWLVYATMANGSKNGEVSADCYVFTANTKKLVMVALGFRFSTMSQESLGKVLRGVNQSAKQHPEPVHSGIYESDTPTTERSMTPVGEHSSKRPVLLEILHKVTDVPLAEIKDECTREELGIDSLMATEVLNDIRATLGLSIDLMTFAEFPNVRTMWTYIDDEMGTGSVQVEAAHPILEVSETVDTKEVQSIIEEQSSLNSAFESFQKIQYAYDSVAIETGAAEFFTKVYPDQARLVLAYVVEAFVALGCDLSTIPAGGVVPAIQPLPRHRKLVRQFYHLLEEAHLVSFSGDGLRRSSVAIDSTPAETLFQNILHHSHDKNLHSLIRAVGSELAVCLNGKKDAIQLLFGNKTTKRLLEDFYERWPLFRTPTLLLGDFLLGSFSNCRGTGMFRILEVGAGTGGTTRHLVDLLRRHGIPFEYTFTDISPSFVDTARRAFKDASDMKFKVLDLEKSPEVEHLGAYHVIIATNCVHATKCLVQTLKFIRQMLREDGVLTLIEITENMCWTDIVVGLLEGWWLFEDGRSHALATETHWEKCLKEAGFGSVAWTDGNSKESQAVRVIAGFSAAQEKLKEPKKRNAYTIKELVYKKVGTTDIHADVYCPADVRAKKLPIALMIHGGSHILFSRKDVRPPQTTLLLEKDFLPVSLDFRLCPEVSLSEGPMVDVCDALAWARHDLPAIMLQNGVQVDGERVVVVGWSSGGQLAMSLAWTAPQKGLRPPEAILAFYCPTNYEDEWWKHPIQPEGAEDTGADYDLLEAIQDRPITNYSEVGAWAPLKDPRIRSDPRCRIVLHINWKAQTLPIIINGLPSRKASSDANSKDWHNLPQPNKEDIRAVSPFAQITAGNYTTPTFLIHGTADELIPWQQTQWTYNAMVERGAVAGLALIEGGPHICDLSRDTESEGWKAVLQGYKFLESFV